MPLKLHCHEFGQGDPLIILHGLFGSSGNWRSIARQLSKAHRVFTVGLRNHGESPHADSMRYEEMADDVAALMDTNGVNKAVLLGHSLGGKVAMTFALERPGRTQALIPVDISPVAYGHRLEGLIQALQDLPLNTLASRREADDHLKSRIGDPVLRGFLLQNLIMRNGQFHWRLHLTGIQSNMDDLLGFPEFPTQVRYLGPACFIRGGESHYLRSEHIPLIKARFPQAQVTTLAEAGHWPHVERPEAFLEAVNTFLESTATRR